MLDNLSEQQLNHQSLLQIKLFLNMNDDSKTYE